MFYRSLDYSNKWGRTLHSETAFSKISQFILSVIYFRGLVKEKKEKRKNQLEE